MASRFMRLPVRRRVREIDSAVIMSRVVSLPEIRAEYLIPEDAVEERSIGRDAIRYTWKVLQVDHKTLEEIFDLDRFEPWGERCADASNEERWWQRHDADRARGGYVSMPAGGLRDVLAHREPHQERLLEKLKEMPKLHDLKGTSPTAIWTDEAGPGLTREKLDELLEKAAKLGPSPIGSMIKMPRYEPMSIPYEEPKGLKWHTESTFGMLTPKSVVKVDPV
jgi:hypothetical protein